MNKCLVCKKVFNPPLESFKVSINSASHFFRKFLCSDCMFKAENIVRA
jgi:hypothetical protein